MVYFIYLYHGISHLRITAIINLQTTRGDYGKLHAVGVGELIQQWMPTGG